MPNVIWRPQPKQAAFMSRPEFEVFYGGAAGGGKSMALMFEALRQVHAPSYRGIIFRRNYKMLEALITETIKWYPRAFPRAKFNDSKKRWTFPTGAHVYFGHMMHEKDKYLYQGQPYDFAGFDELPQFTESMYTYIKNSRMRPTEGGTRVYVRGTGNPGGEGTYWVKDRFITAAPPFTRMWETIDIKMPDGSTRHTKKDRCFIPATVFDNPALLENNPGYIDSLAGLPEAERNALLYGDWNSYEGQVFREWTDDPAHYRDGVWTHVIAPIPIKSHWRIWRSFDFGYAKPFSVMWYAVTEDGKIYIIREFYGCTSKANNGVMMHPHEIARSIKEIENTDPLLAGKAIAGVADPSIFDQSRGQSIAYMMGESPNFISWMPGDNTRLAGLQQYHYRFAFDANGECQMQVFNTCRHFIRTIPTLTYDEKHVEDVNTSLEDHIYDSCRYLLMENPISPQEPTPRQPRVIDPLDRRTTVFR